MKTLLTFLSCLFAFAATAQVPPFIRNSFDTNTDFVAKGLVTNIANSLVATGNFVLKNAGTASNLTSTGTQTNKPNDTASYVRWLPSVVTGPTNPAFLETRSSTVFDTDKAADEIWTLGANITPGGGLFNTAHGNAGIAIQLEHGYHTGGASYDEYHLLFNVNGIPYRPDSWRLNWATNSPDWDFTHLIHASQNQWFDATNDVTPYLALAPDQLSYLLKPGYTNGLKITKSSGQSVQILPIGAAALQSLDFSGWPGGLITPVGTMLPTLFSMNQTLVMGNKNIQLQDGSANEAVRFSPTASILSSNSTISWSRAANVLSTDLTLASTQAATLTLRGTLDVQGALRPVGSQSNTGPLTVSGGLTNLGGYSLGGGRVTALGGGDPTFQGAISVGGNVNMNGGFFLGGGGYAQLGPNTGADRFLLRGFLDGGARLELRGSTNLGTPGAGSALIGAITNAQGRVVIAAYEVQVPTNSAPFTLITSNLLSGQTYTNLTQRGHVVATISMTNILAGDVSAMSLIVDQDADGTWDTTNGPVRINGVALSAGSEQLFGLLQPGARFAFTNQNAGITPSAEIITGSCQWSRW